MAATQVLADIAKLATPKGYLDVATLGLVALGTVGALTHGKLWDKPDPYAYLMYERPQLKDAAGRAAKKETRNIAQKLEESGKDLVVFWGSQSGTAEGFANRLARECHLRFGLETMAADLSDFDPETIAFIPQSKLAVFIVSTFGEGDPSDNTAGLWEWIHKQGDVSLSNIRYMAFGLGNRNYKYYNRVVDVVVEALDKFGAKSLLPVGRADDAEGATEEDFISWKDSVFTVFKKDLGFEKREMKYEPTLAVVEDDSLDIIDLFHGEPVQQRENPKVANTNTPVKALTIKHARELFTSKERNCLHLDLDLSDQPELHYKTGDHLAVWPSNPDTEVERLLRVLNLTDRKDIPLSIKSLDKSVKFKIPTPTSTAALFRYYLEICAHVSRDTLLSLAPFAPTLAAKSFILALGKDKDAFATYQTRNVVTLGRILEAATKDEGSTATAPVWTNLPLSFLVESLPHVQPRYYSISSSSVTHPRTPSITAVVSTTQLRDNAAERVYGLTTNYLLALKQSLAGDTAGAEPHPHGLTYALNGPNGVLASEKVYAHIRKSKFKLPVLSSHPIIMVAAGTGIAPFRAFLAERARLKTMGRPIGRMMLFFGCRREDEDFLYRDELTALQQTLNSPNDDGSSNAGKETLTIITAFSRASHSPSSSAKKIYVQDRITENAEEVCGLLVEQNANMYICGSAAMAREVAKSVGSSLMRVKDGEESSGGRGWSEGEWKEWSDKQKRSGKWQEDVWG